MDLRDKTFCSKESLKFNLNRCFNNIKDFHGHRQPNDGSIEKHKMIASKKEEMRKKSKVSNFMRVKSYSKRKHSSSQPSHNSDFIRVVEPPTKTIASIEHNFEVESREHKCFLDDHVKKWAEEFNKPLTVSSAHVEFEMPYCYSEEFFNELSAKYYLSQPFNSAVEPLVTWNSHMDVSHERAQLALQFYRQLCGQPSRMQAQGYAFMETELCLESVNSDRVVVGADVLYQQKNTATGYFVPSHGSPVKHHQECSQILLKNYGSIYTSSWQY